MKHVINLVLFSGLIACAQSKRERINYDGFIAVNNLQSLREVRQFRFQGWQPLSDRFMVLRSNQQKSYLIKFMSPCIDLPFANNIKLQQDMSYRLQSKFDSVVIPGQFRQTCRIDAIYSLDKNQRKDLLTYQ